MKKQLILFVILFISLTGIAQIEPSVDLMKFYTSEWEGERDEKGRPLVSDELLDRLLNLSIEEAWGVIRGDRYFNQFEGGPIVQGSAWFRTDL